VRAGARRQPAGVRADDARARLGRDDRQLRLHPAPGVVDDVGAGGQRLPGHLGAPGVDRDRQLRVRRADRGDQVDGPADLLGGVHLGARGGLHPTDVDHVRTLGHHPPDPGQRGVQLVGRPAVVERVRGAVDDGHHDQPAVRHGQGPESQHPPSQADAMI
jgi:hypothetical protein